MTATIFPLLRPIFMPGGAPAAHEVSCEDMNFFRRHWYDIGAIVAIGAVVALIVLWQQMSMLQRLLLNFIVLLVHQYEECGWPGGEPAIMNMVLKPSTTPDRYPLNQNSAMVINVLAVYGFYLVPVFFPNVQLAPCTTQ